MLHKLKSFFTKKDSKESSIDILYLENTRLKQKIYALESKNNELVSKYNNVVNAYNKIKADFESYKQKVQDNRQRSRENAELRRLEQENQKEFEKSLEYYLPLLEDSNITAKNLLGIHEFIIYKALIFCENIRDKFIILPQVSFKRFIVNNSDNDAWKAFSNLDCDFLLVIKDFKNMTTSPFATIEYHGGGHFNNDEEGVKKRDTIKEFVTQKVGLKHYVIHAKEVVMRDNPRMINDALLKVKIQQIADSLAA